MRKKIDYVPPAKPTVLKVKEESDLMTFLLAKMGGMKRNSVKQLLAHRQVMINNQVVTLFSTPVKANDIVEIKSSRGITELNHPKLRIIFEDHFLIVVEKSEGLLTVSTGKTEETTAFSILKTHVKVAAPTNRIYVVHRLDRETSGVLIFAKSRDVQLYLQEHWHTIVTRRVYVALVEGKVEKEKDTIVSWLSEHEKSLKIRSSAFDNGGQQAITHYRRIKFNDQLSLLELELETGRKNQIRVHMQSIGHPITGDKKYGSDINPLGRVGLHARMISFKHPETGEVLHFETPVPRSFLKFFHQPSNSIK